MTTSFGDSSENTMEETLLKFTLRFMMAQLKVGENEMIEEFISSHPQLVLGWIVGLFTGIGVSALIVKCVRLVSR